MAHSTSMAVRKLAINELRWIYDLMAGSEAKSGVHFAKDGILDVTSRCSSPLVLNSHKWFFEVFVKF